MHFKNLLNFSNTYGVIIVGGEFGYIIINSIDLKHFMHVQHMHLSPLEDEDLAMSKADFMHQGCVEQKF